LAFETRAYEPRQLDEASCRPTDTMRDLRYVLRALRKSPGFAVVAVASLALGIGANTAIYGVARALLTDPLPVAEPERLMAVAHQFTPPKGVRGIWQINGTSHRDPATGRSYRAPISYPVYRALRDAAAGSADVFAFTFLRELNVSAENQAVSCGGVLATGGYFSGLGVGIALGRPLTDEDDRPGASAAVISHALWTRLFGGDPAVVGRQVRINAVRFTIVGVTAPGFVGVSKGGFFPPTDITIPLGAQPALMPQWGPPGRSLFLADEVFWLHAMARLKAGASVSGLQTVLTTRFAGMLAESSYPALRQASAVELHLVPGGRGVDELSRRVEQPLGILRGVAIAVLLIACVNLANLMLARGVARQREMSIRLALGSGRLRLVRSAILESVCLSAAGGVLGVALGIAAGRVLLAMLTASTGTTAISVPVQWRLIAMAAALACGAGLLCGLLPAVRFARRDYATALKQVAASVAPRLGVGRLLMGAQVAISVPLLLGAVLFLRTLHNLDRVDPGFDPERLVLFRLDPSLNGYDRERVERMYAEVRERVETVPGVRSATLMGETLLRGWSSSTTVTIGRSEPSDMYFNTVGPRFFETLGIPLVAGRAIGVQDDGHAPRVAVVNETAVRKFFNGTSPIGGRIHAASFGQGPVDFEVVGVVKDSKYDSLRKAAVPTMFLPYAQLTGAISSLTVAVRAAGDPSALGAALRSAVAEVDSDVPVNNLRTQAAQIAETLGTERAFTRLLVTFGLFALFLACIGLHGVTSYSVARRTSEIGIRVALGARRADVVWLVLRQVVAIAACGLAVGIPLAMLSTRLVRAMLYGVEPADPLSLALACAVMSVVAGLAGFFPARRAARLDPLKALRCE
jgi:predicted permease